MYYEHCIVPLKLYYEQYLVKLYLSRSLYLKTTYIVVKKKLLRIQKSPCLTTKIF